MTKSPQFIRRFLAKLMKMLLDTEEDIAGHTTAAEDEDVVKTSSYSVGQECLGRFATALDEKTIVLIASEQLPACWAASEQKTLQNAGVLLSGGFGDHGVEGTILAAKYAGENNVLYTGIFLGIPMSMVEFARCVVGLERENV